MTTDPHRIRAQIDALLAELPDIASDVDLDEVAQRLDEAHEALVHALESVEKG
jgi:hypothetical protein